MSYAARTLCKNNQQRLFLRFGDKDLPLVKCLACSVHAALGATVGDQTGATLRKQSAHKANKRHCQTSLTKKAAVATPRPIAKVDAILRRQDMTEGGQIRRTTVIVRSV